MKKIMHFLVAFIVILMTGCATSSKDSTVYKGASTYTQPPIEILPLNTTYPLNQKLDDLLEEKLNQKIEELFVKHNIAGLTATVLIPEKGIWETTRGYISKPEHRVVDSDTVFFWASVGKLINSTIVHQLIVSGKLSFDDKISQWFPDIQNADKITIEHLLTHTNGIYNFNADPDFNESNEGFTPSELLEIAKLHENIFDPGEYWSYTNTGYLLLSFIVEKIESKTYAQIVKEKISTPLHLQTLRAFVNDDPHLALPHDNSKVIYRDYTSLLGAGGFVSNSKDMATFLSALLTEKIIPIKNVHNMMKNLYPMFGGMHQYYGRGIMLYDFTTVDQTNTIWIGHSGGTENYKAILFYDTESKIIMAISINENISANAVGYALMKIINNHKIQKR